MRYVTLVTLILLAACGKSEPASIEKTLSSVDSAPLTTSFNTFKRLDEETSPAPAKVKLDMMILSLKEYFISNEITAKVGGNPGPKGLCSEMKKVGLGCPYNERIGLTSYLAANGKNLFTCGDGSNPYFSTTKDCDLFTTEERQKMSFYIGQPGQSIILERSVRKNIRLFKNGDLQPEAAARWDL